MAKNPVETGDKRERLLDTALRLFVQSGFHDTPTSRIAKEAGIANGTLFYFFPTKDELVKAVYVHVKGRMSAHMYDSIKAEKTLHDILKAYYTAALNWALTNSTEFRFIEQFNSSPYLAQVSEEDIGQHVRPLMHLLNKGVADGIIKPMDVEIIYTLISAHTLSIKRYLVAKQFPKDRQDAVISDTFELLWDMIT